MNDLAFKERYPVQIAEKEKEIAELRDNARPLRRY